MSSGIIIRILIDGEYFILSRILLLGLLIPSFSLVCGIIAGSPRLFEVIYLLQWYIGINGAGILNFKGMTKVGITGENLLIYLVTILLLLSTAFLARFIQHRKQ